MPAIWTDVHQAFEPGDLVETPSGVGRVAYRRMAPPTYATVEAYSVVVLRKEGAPGYAGSIFRPHELKLIRRAS